MNLGHIFKSIIDNFFFFTSFHNVTCTDEMLAYKESHLQDRSIPPFFIHYVVSK